MPWCTVCEVHRQSTHIHVSVAPQSGGGWAGLHMLTIEEVLVVVKKHLSMWSINSSSPFYINLTPSLSPRVQVWGCLLSVSVRLEAPVCLNSPVRLNSTICLDTPVRLGSPVTLFSPFCLDSPVTLYSPVCLDSTVILDSLVCLDSCSSSALLSISTGPPAFSAFSLLFHFCFRCSRASFSWPEKALTEEFVSNVGAEKILIQEACVWERYLEW